MDVPPASVADLGRGTEKATVLLASDFRTLATSPVWAERFGAGEVPLTCPPFGPDASEVARAILVAGVSGALPPARPDVVGEVFVATPMRGADGAAVLLVEARLDLGEREIGWRRPLFDLLSSPLLLVGPGGRVLQANRAAAALPVQRLDDLAETAADATRLQDALTDAIRGHVAFARLASGRRVGLQPLAGLALVEVGAVPATAGTPHRAVLATGGLALEARAELQTLLGHLDLLRETPLTRVQQAQLDCAIETADDLAQHFRTEPAAAPAPAISVVPEGRAWTSARVLIVDDDPTNLHVAKGMFEVLGIHAEAVESGADALAVLGAGSYDLVLLDMMMPGMGGIEVARTIRDRYGRRPLIMVVTAQAGAREACLEAGVDLYLTKPLRLADLSRTLDLGMAV